MEVITLPICDHFPVIMTVEYRGKQQRGERRRQYKWKEEQEENYQTSIEREREIQRTR